MATETVIPSKMTEAQVERAICARSFPRFLEHVRIPDPPPAGVGIVPFTFWPHLMRLDKACEAVAPSGTLPVGKSRKIGITSYFEARFTWISQFQRGAFLPVISQGEKEAMKVIADSRFIWEHLPPHVRADLVQDNATLLKFRDGGTIEAFPATGKAGRSYTGTEILFDEADYHDDFEASYNALLPLIGDTGGKMFLVSTFNPDKVDSVFRQVYRRASNRLFLGYFERPGRTQAGYEAAGKLASNQYYFEKENARTEEEALAPSRIRAYFNLDALTSMLTECREPVEMRLGGLIRIWRKPVVGARYVGAGDVCWGHASAYSCFPIADWQTGVQMAEIYGRPEHDEYAKAIADLTTEYNKAYFGVEANGETTERSGLNVINKLITLGLGDRMYHHGENWRDDERQRGCLTTSATRPVILGELEEAVRLRQVVPMCRDAVGEMMSFVRNEKGRAEATTGAYADHVMAWAWLWQMRKTARYSVGSTPVIYTGRW